LEGFDDKICIVDGEVKVGSRAVRAEASVVGGNDAADGGVATGMGCGAVSMGVFTCLAVGAMGEARSPDMSAVVTVVIPGSVWFLNSRSGIQFDGFFHSEEVRDGGIRAFLIAIERGSGDGDVTVKVWVDAVPGLG